MRTQQTQIVTNGNMASTIYSIGIDCFHQMIGSIQCVSTGSPAGTYTIQTSNDIVQDAIITSGSGDPAANVINWIDDPAGAKTIASAGGVMVIPSNVEGIPYRWVRLKYVPSGGSGSLNAIMVSKGN